MKICSMEEDYGHRKLKLKKGDTFRSEDIYVCEICSTRTNKWEYNGALVPGPKLICPAEIFEEHDILEKLKEEYGNIIDNDEVTDTCLKEVEGKINSYEHIFGRRFDNLEGIDTEKAKEIPYVPATRHRSKIPLPES